MTTRDGDTAERSQQAWARAAWLRALEKTAPIGQDITRTLPVVIDELASRLGDASALESRDSRLSYRALSEQAHRYARWGLSQNLRAGEVVALLMPNKPEYVAIWLGLTRIGVAVALINTQLRAELLARAAQTVSPRCVIVDSTLVDAWEGARPHLGSPIPGWASGEASEHDMPALAQSVATLSGDALTAQESAFPTLTDRALYIYTSGTTGLPKAAVVSHRRLMQWSHWFAGLMETGPTDRMYDCLPLYHSVGGIVAIGATLVGGGAVVLRERFSAREFWVDIVEERCTLFQYIGELCRYLCNSPAAAAEHNHHLRLCCGNGLRTEVWGPFQQRFHIPRILEYYAATEANFSLYNCEGRIGAVGRIPPFLRHRLPVALIRIDADSGNPIRDPAGRCLRCAVGEAGEAIGQVMDAAGAPSGRFEGYADTAASAQKLLRDVFQPGDVWYRSGDLLRQDDDGFFYFVDRLGDTFRWKGENVSTSEVSAVIATIPGVTDAVVYGVTVPGAEGRAGMCALVANELFDLKAFRRHVVEQLPSYAKPLFLRLVRSLELTGTLRPTKQALITSGYDPAQTDDPLYLDDRALQSYISLDGALFQSIRSGRLAF
jgi:fatty-acyl-CoA synthase